MTDGPSLSSRLIVTAVVVADRMRAMTLPGPRDTLRLECCSLDRARWRLRGFLDLEGLTVRLVAAPGRSNLAAGLLGFFFSAIWTGPPSFLLTDFEIVGSRDEKLDGQTSGIMEDDWYLQRDNDVCAKVTQRFRRILMG